MTSTLSSEGPTSESNDDLVEVDDQGEVTNTVFDGLVMIGRLTDIRTLKSSKTGNVIEGIANAVFATSRGEEIIAIQRVLRTPLGAFNMAAFDKLTNRLAINENWVVTVGKQVTNGFTNYVAIDCKVF